MLSRDECSINSSSVNQERLSVLTKPREFKINIMSSSSKKRKIADERRVFQESGKSCILSLRSMI